MHKPLKPPALGPGSTIAVVSPASSAKRDRILRGCENLERLDYHVHEMSPEIEADGYFAGPLASRLEEFRDALVNPRYRAIFCTRGGYGSAQLLDQLKIKHSKKAKIFCGFSDLTSVHIFL